MLSRNSECVTGASDTGYRPTVLAATDGVGGMLLTSAYDTLPTLLSY